MEEISEHTETLQAIAKDLMETINRFKLALSHGNDLQNTCYTGIILDDRLHLTMGK